MAHDVASPENDLNRKETNGSLESKSGLTRSEAAQTELLRAIQQRLIQRVGEERMQTWIPTPTRWELQGEPGQSERLRLVLPNTFLVDCLKDFMLKDLRDVVHEVLGVSAGVSLSADQNLGTAPSAGVTPTSHAAGTLSPDCTPRPASGLKWGQNQGNAQPVAASPDKSVYGVSGSGIRPILVPIKRVEDRVDYWADFIEGNSNRMARSAALLSVESPGKSTPLLLHGPTGVGKSHLARAIADQLRTCHRMRRVIYLTGEQFTIDFTDSARGSGFANFRKKYRDVEALILDDVQFLIGKANTLIELRNTIDFLLNQKRQVVLVSDRSWGELGPLGSELLGRISGGMVCAMDPLEEEGRITLLQRLCEREQVVIDTTTLESLVKLAGNDARILHGITNRLLHRQRLAQRPLTFEESLECCQDLLRASQPVVRIADIEKVVCDAFGLERRSLQTKCKTKSVSQPRMLAMFLARKYTRAAYSEIGTYFGKRQHSTVISAQKKVEDWIANDSMVDHSRGSVSIREMLRTLEVNLQVG